MIEKFIREEMEVGEFRKLAKDIIDMIEDIPDVCAETFLFMLIGSLREEFL